MSPSGFYLLAVAAAAALVAVEMWIERRPKRDRADLDGERPRSSLLGTLVDASHFIGELTLTALLHLNLFAAYRLLEGRFSLMTWDAGSPLTWIVTLLAIDLSYWVGHVACHRVGALWALHSVHHQSHQFNFAAGVRGPWLSALQIAPFAIPLLALGLPSSVLFVVYAGHTAWKMLVHTRLVGKLGILEKVLATPSQHRVHHGTNAHYVDKNFGGLFSIWDRLFGTFQVEDEEPVLVATASVETHDPLAQNVLPLRELGRHARRVGWMRALFGRPAPMQRPAAAALPTSAATSPRAGERRMIPVVLAFAFAAIGAIALTASMVNPDGLVGWALGAAVVAALVLMGKLADRIARPITAT